MYLERDRDKLNTLRHSDTENQTGNMINMSMAQHLQRDHPLQKAWLLNAALGMAGVVLNCIVLTLAMLERKSLISSINAMIL